MNKDLLVNNDLKVENKAIIKDLEIKQDLIVNGNEIINGELIINNDLYVNKNLYLEGTLKTTNLEVIGNKTIIDTETYKTENIEVVNDSGDGPSINIIHNDLTNDIIRATNINNKSFTIDKDGKVGINIKPTVEFEVNGDSIIHGKLTVYGPQNANSDYNIGGSLSVNKDIYTNQNLIIEGTQIVQFEYLQ